MKIEKYYNNLNILNINTERDRAYCEVYSCMENAEKGKEDRTLTLNGEWDFMYFDCVDDVPESFKDGNSEGFDKIPVPSCWQMHGYDGHQYTNTRYPFPFNPPYVPYKNPCGAYVTHFEGDTNHRQYLNFEGVDSCFYVWINGEFAGYSQVSHSTSEFDITDKVKKGDNVLCVLVMKWCDGSYLEDQDKFRMSGIFRDVYILSRPEKRVTDYKIETDISGKIKIKTEANTNVSFVLKNEKGILYSGSDNEINIKNPILWNAEHPYLYTLYIVTDDEVIRERVGLREIKTEDGIVLFNGKPIKMRGVNRHDSDPIVGYAVTREMAKRDLFLMKRHNINAVRTSHYPNSPWFLQMCDEYGFYVIAESDIEIHGTAAIYGGSQAETFGLLANNPEWEKAILQRVQKNVIRDKNRTCICLWSLGNEGGYGVNFEKSLKWVKEYDSSRLTHYESSMWQHDGHINDTSMLDVESTMYADYKWIDNYFKEPGEWVWRRISMGKGSEYGGAGEWVKLSDTDLNETERKCMSIVKPYMQCEFMHAMGNGPGGIKEYIDRLYRYDGFFGVFAWEWCDHAVDMGDGKYFYGGDFGETIHDGNFCVDGLVYPDRRPHTGLLEYKQAIKPFVIKSYSNIIVVENRYDFTDLSDALTFEVNGSEIVFDVPPRGKKSFPKPEGDMLMIRAYQKNDTPWAKKGFEVGFDQIILKDSVRLLEIPEALSGEFSVNEDDRYIRISGENFEYVFDKAFGGFSKLNNAVSKLTEWNIWRAPTDNDRNIAPEWKNAGFDREKPYVYDVSCEIGETAKIVCRSALIPDGQRKVLDIEAAWTVYKNGIIDLTADVNVDEIMPMLPRFGIRIFTEGEKIKYYGYGPYESYSDKHLASYVGEFDATVDEMYEDYIKPQENGSRFGTRYVETEKLRISSNVPFSFNASHYTQEELTKRKHNFELKKSKDTVLCIDYKQNGIGQNSCGSLPLEEYRFDEKNFTFNIRIEIKR